MSDESSDLDPGIRRTVGLIRSWGFATSDSGDGRSKLGTPAEGCMMPMPNVTIPSVRDLLLEEAETIRDRLRECGIDLMATRDEDGQAVPLVQIEAVYLPVEGGAFILLTGLDDDMLAAAEASRG